MMKDRVIYERRCAYRHKTQTHHEEKAASLAYHHKYFPSVAVERKWLIDLVIRRADKESSGARGCLDFI